MLTSLPAMKIPRLQVIKYEGFTQKNWGIMVASIMATLVVLVGTES